MTRILRAIFHAVYKVPRLPVVSPLDAETICRCGTVAHPADYFCVECGARLR